jgi:hypothetical protein
MKGRKYFDLPRKRWEAEGGIGTFPTPRSEGDDRFKNSDVK